MSSIPNMTNSNYHQKLPVQGCVTRLKMTHLISVSPCLVFETDEGRHFNMVCAVNHSEL